MQQAGANRLCFFCSGSGRFRGDARELLQDAGKFHLSSAQKQSIIETDFILQFSRYIGPQITSDGRRNTYPEAERCDIWLPKRKDVMYGALGR